jgi:RimJ/RimL family protein N-acetyltransferase
MACLAIETPRLVLEPLEETHAEVLFEGLCDERLYEFIDHDPPASMENLRTRYAKLAGRRSPDGTEAWLNWAVREMRTERYVGFVQATVNSSRLALIAYLLFHPAWGNGYGREAVSAMIQQLHEKQAVTTFRATVDPRNQRSMALLQALSFALFEHRKGTARVHGAVADELEYRLDGNSLRG